MDAWVSRIYTSRVEEVIGGSSSIAGCSKRPFSKAAGESKPEAYPLGYVEDFDEPRTKLAGYFNSLSVGGHMSFPTDEQQQIQLELEGLKRTLEWTEIQREQLLDRLDLLRIDNARLQDRVEELERQVEGLKQQQPLF